MRAALTAVSVAALLLGLHFLLRGEGFVAATPNLSRGQQSLAERDAMASSLSGGRRSGAEDPEASAYGRVFPHRDLKTAASERGIVGEAVTDLIDRLRGARVPPDDRSFALYDLSRILNAWHQDPERLAEDAEFLLRVWNELEDPAIRWALSLVFQRVPEDRFVPALLDLKDVDPIRMGEALAGIATPFSLETLAAQVDTGDFGPKNPEVRASFISRLSLSAWEKAPEWLSSVATDPRRSADERFAALSGLSGHLEGDETRAMVKELAFGPPMTLSGALKAQGLDHPERDLRSAAVVALFRAGSSADARALLERAESPAADANFRAMVDRHLIGYQGPNLGLYLVDRAKRQGSLTMGTALYLERHAQAIQPAVLMEARAFATDAKMAAILDAAIQRAQNQ